MTLAGRRAEDDYRRDGGALYSQSRQQAEAQGPGVPADPPAARASRLSAGNLGLNSTGTLQGFHHFSGKPTVRSSESIIPRCRGVAGPIQYAG